MLGLEMPTADTTWTSADKSVVRTPDKTGKGAMYTVTDETSMGGVKRFVRANPLGTIGLSFGAGFLTGYLVGSPAKKAS